MHYQLGLTLDTNELKQDMIDVNEAGFKIESTNPNFGKTVSWLRCYLEGEYNRDKKVNCVMAISANGNYNMAWHDIRPQKGGGLMSTGCIHFSGG